MVCRQVPSRRLLRWQASAQSIRRIDRGDLRRKPRVRSIGPRHAGSCPRKWCQSFAQVTEFEGGKVEWFDVGRSPVILPPGRFRPTISLVTGHEFIRKVRALGKARKVTVVLNSSRGKGSHQTLCFGTAFTIVRNPKDELKTGTVHAMCLQLGVKPGDL